MNQTVQHGLPFGLGLGQRRPGLPGGQRCARDGTRARHGTADRTGALADGPGREHVAALVVLMPGVALDPLGANPALVGRGVQQLPDGEVGDDLALGIAEALGLPATAPFGQPLQRVLRIRDQQHLGSDRRHLDAMQRGPQFGDLVRAMAEKARAFDPGATVGRDDDGAPGAGPRVALATPVGETGPD